MQSANDTWPEIDEAQLRLLWTQPLPNPQRQADLLMIALGDTALPIERYVLRPAQQFCAEIGTQDDPVHGRTSGFLIIVRRLIEHGLVQQDPHAPAANVGLRLTFDGWAAYEKLRREVVQSKTAFMAMSFNNSVLDKVVADYFVPAVRDAGFELYKLSDKPKSGLIDFRIRVEIRSAKFLVCDLSDENRGAYWEAGFAEGCQKPVFYTCERNKFDEAKTHFDTEHMFTILWNSSDPAGAAEELKMAVRNEFPNEAIPPGPRSR